MQTSVKTNTFHAELGGTTSAMQTAAKLDNITIDKTILYNDNEATISFIKGNYVAKGCRHMEMREWCTREEYQMGKVDIEHMSGDKLVADHMTKLGTIKEHQFFCFSPN